MNSKEYLESKGWKMIKQYYKYRQYYLWDHKEHQHSRRGFFTNTQAIEHQKKLDKGFKCTCYPVAGEERK